jgi:hypothetical protein
MIGGIIMNAKESFVFIASWAEAIEAYDKAGQPELGGELAKQIIYYGTMGKMTTDNPLIEGFVKAMCTELIDRSKKKYNACKSNGNKGGRPEKYPVEEMIQLRHSGLTDEEIAQNLGCSTQTVIKKLAAFDDEDI